MKQSHKLTFKPASNNSFKIYPYCRNCGKKPLTNKLYFVYLLITSMLELQTIERSCE